MSKLIYAVAIVLGIGCLVLVAVLAHACSPENYPSVHFNTAEPDFGKPPRTLSIYSWKELESRPIGCPPRINTESEANWEQERQSRAIGEEALKNARRLEEAGRFDEAMPHYRNALKHGIGERELDEFQYGPDLKAAIMDREELSEELTPDTDRALLNKYLAARRNYESSRPGHGEAQMKALAANPRAGILRAHALYVLGAIQFDAGHFPQAAAIFERLASLYPQSRRREAALMMIPRSLLQVPKLDASFTRWVGKPLPNAMARSRQALQTLLHDYPRSRFRHSAQAWLARCDYLQGRKVAALEAYLHQYTTFTDTNERTRAAASIVFVSGELTTEEAKQLRADFHQNARILGDYLEFRLEHTDALDEGNAQLANLAMELNAHEPLHLSARAAARLAEALYLIGRYHDAIDWATQALTEHPEPGRDLALYVRGASYRKSKQAEAAIADFAQLLQQYPTSYLCGGARENLALLYERSGRPGLALDQYFTLGYDEDIAYVLDARMTTDQVAAYLETHPDHPKHDLLVYTLGIRQLRDNQLAQARATLARLPEETLKRMMAPKGEKWQGHDQLRDPRIIAGDLANLEQAVTQAEAPNAKAEAQYTEASFIYTNRDLLFYNYPLWHGGRSSAFSQLWFPAAATPDDVAAVQTHHHEHECLYRARALCLEIAKQYPQSPTAPKALYRAACASYLLANFNDWWRKEAVRLHLANEAVSLMQRVYQEYPHDPLAPSARKFAKAFAEEYAQTVRDRMFEVAKK